MSLQRKRRREMMKEKTGSRGLRGEWSKWQQNNYGTDFQRVCRPKSKKKK